MTLLPRDTNPHGTIFGGIILSYIDQAGAIEAHLHGARKLVTVCMREVVFHAPVNLGDLVSFYGELIKLGTTSITVHITVEVLRAGAPDAPRKVTEAEVVYVNVDDQGRPTPIVVVP
ncbi:MAG: hotdog domain-containing protein [Pseudomonadota bacterium]